MTPTLEGRWQTRFFLLTVLGIPVTLLFGLLYSDFAAPLLVLGLVLALGFGWDALYYMMQCRRWNHDWPPLYALIGGMVEGLAVCGLMQLSPLLSPVGLTVPALAHWQFWAHYGTVFVLTWLASMGLMHVLFIRWRFRGGQWL